MHTLILSGLIIIGASLNSNILLASDAGGGSSGAGAPASAAAGVSARWGDDSSGYEEHK